MADGLSCFPEFITEGEETELLQLVDTLPWLDIPMKRRVQHYGYEYVYTHNRTGPLDLLRKAPPIPATLLEVALRIPAVGINRKSPPNQLIVNEYLPGQGIGRHTDDKQVFGDTIATITLGCGVPIVFKRGVEEVTVLAPRRSCLVLEREARYEWTHEIIARPADHLVPRRRRVSLTYRKADESFCRPPN